MSIDNHFVNHGLTFVKRYLTKHQTSFALPYTNSLMMNRFLLCLLLLIEFVLPTRAQQSNDTLKLSLPDAEKLFLQRNLALLSQQYNIDISQALVQQARYWDNPVLSTDQNIYDGKWFRHTTIDGQPYGQIYVQLQQVIKTAGKRNKLITLAKDQTLSAQQQFNDLLRNLKYVLTTDFITVTQLLETNKLYLSEISSMEKMVVGMDAELQAGNISEKENLRIKALLYSLQSDQADILTQLADVQKELHTLLQQNDTTIIVPIAGSLPGDNNITLNSLLDSARGNRPDLQLARTNLLTQQHNLSYQKALVSPDLTVGIEYDHASTYVPNYWGLTVGLPVPILNRNKGNINAAGIAIKQANTGILQAEIQVEQDVTAAYNKYLVTLKLKNSLAPGLDEKYDRLLQNMMQSYQQRQVSLIEFIDFFGAYKDSSLKKLQLQATLRNAAAELNFTTGTPIIIVQ